MNIPVNEQETIVNFTRGSNEARIYTTDTTVLTKLHKLISRNSKDWKLVRQDRDSVDHDVIAETYSCPKSLIRFRAVKQSRVITDEQREKFIERIKNSRTKKAEAKNRES